MKKSAVAAATIIGVSALTGATVLPGSAASDSAVHTKKLVLREIASHQLTESQFTGSDQIRSARTHAVVGFHAFTGRYYPAKATAVLQGALALKGGILLGRVPVPDGATTFEGRITGGSGKYAGAEGTITGHFGEAATYVTLHYRY